MTPKILLELKHPIGSTKVKRKTLYENQKNEVKKLNIILVTGAQKFAYSKNKALLKNLLASMMNPGPLEKEYIKKYVIPWEKFRTKTGR